MQHSLLRVASLCALSLLSACGSDPTPTFDDTPQDTGLSSTDAASDGADANKGDGATVGDAPGASDAIATETETDASDAAADAALACDTPIRCYVDADGDGYAKNDGSILACTCPTGHLATAPTSGTADCNDDNPNVHPGVTTFYDTPYCVGAGCATKSFDYDCSGVEEKKETNLFTACSSFLSGCSGAGWAGTAAPACGAAGDFTTCSAGLAACTTANASKKQLCR